MRRVMIVGGSGSGKSTLARWLGDRTGLPVFHMDHIHWQPGWVARPRDARRTMAEAVEAQDRWIFEGGFSNTYASRLARADTVIWLDLPVGLRLRRVLMRQLRYWGKRRPDMAEGCQEGLHAEALLFYVWIWQTRHSGRAKITELLKDAHPALTLHHLQTVDDVTLLQSQFARPTV